MTLPSSLILSLAAVCALWAAVTLVLITRDVERRGLRTPWPLIGFHFFRNLEFYRAETLQRTGTTGPLFYGFVVPINAALILALLALVLF